MEVESMEVHQNRCYKQLIPNKHLLSSVPLFFLSFVFNWAEISKRRLLPFSIVKHFSIIKHCCFCFFSCLIDGLTNPFFFQCSPKTLDQSVIITIPLSTHAHLNPSLMQHFLIALACVFASSIRMMDQVHSKLALDKCHLKGLLHQQCIVLLSHRPSNQLT